MTANPCPLCTPEDTVFRDELAYICRDNIPLSAGHVLIVPVRHVADYFDMTPDEKSAISRLLDRAKAGIDREHKPDGYNIGVNIGKAAGQNRMHVHVHLIPRYAGDVADPKGGIRCVLAKKKS